MSILSILTLSLGLAMDATAAAICKGLAIKHLSMQKAVIISIYFGFFQGFMPLLGYTLGMTFCGYFTQIAHWIAFILLVLIGITMMIEACSKKEDALDDSTDFSTMIVLAIATSIDAFAVGVTFALMNAPILFAILCIGGITFLLSLLGVKIGCALGIRYKSKAEFTGGTVLILLGIKILFSK